MPCFDELEKRIRESPCPQCHAKPLDFILRCDFFYQDCLYTARCDRCHYLFAIADDMRVAGVSESTLITRLKSTPCPYCGQLGLQLGFGCDLLRDECFYTAECASCLRTIDVRGIESILGPQVCR